MWKLLARYLRPYTWLIVGVVVAQLIGTIASLYLPSLQAKVIDQGVAKGDTHRIWVLGGWMLLTSLVQILGQVTAAYLGSRTAMKTGANLRSSIFHRVLSWSSREVSRFGAPSLITRTTNDVQQIQQFIQMTLVMMASAPIMMIGGVIMAVREDAGMSWLIVVAVLVLAVGIGILVARATPLFGRLQKQIDVLNRVLREQITGVRVVRAFVREPAERERFDRANSDITATTTSVGRTMAVLFPFVMLIMNISSVGVLWFGAQRVDAGHTQVGQLMAFLSYLMQILISVMMATLLVMIAPRAAVCAKRINEVLDTDTTLKWAPHGRTDFHGRGHVVLDNVSFSYPGAEVPVLKNVSLEILPGQLTAIIGSTGAGKSTLVNLIPRLYDATGGRVEIDGVDVREADPDTLWARIGLVPQKPYLFSGTIASNLRYGNPEATDDELWRALEIAQAADFVRELPEQLAAPVAQGGTNVSGGQRQRLAIARALVKRCDIYIFDDSFSALDVGTDARLRAALAQETADTTVLIVAQRVSTITGADQIIVIEDGEVVGRGTHEELLINNEIYREIVESQLSVEVAA